MQTTPPPHAILSRGPSQRSRRRPQLLVSFSLPQKYWRIAARQERFGRSIRAIPQRALAIQDVKTPNSLALAATYDTIGKLLRNKGDIGGALEQHRRALAIRELIGRRSGHVDQELGRSGRVGQAVDWKVSVKEKLLGPYLKVGVHEFRIVWVAKG